MISCYTVKKTLLDMGNFEVDGEYSDKTGGCFYSVSCPSITGLIRLSGEKARICSIVVQFSFLRLQHEINAHFPNWQFGNGCRILSIEDLEKVVIHANKLISTHPEWQALVESAEDFNPEFDALSSTEEELLCRVRVAQSIYRRGLENLWGGCCAVTGVSVRELLRASHAKPWAECATGTERISPYNGFLLVANLDALFDKFLISFDDDGIILISSTIPEKEWELIGISKSMRLRFVKPDHLPYLRWHQSKFFRVSQESKLEI